MEINIALVTYEVELITETGTVFDLTPALIGLLWEEDTNGLSAKANITLANIAIGSTWLMAIAKIGCLIRVYSDWGIGKEKVYEGKIWEWTYSSALQKEISLTTYDNAKYLLQSYDYYYFSAGLNTTALLEAVCSSWGVVVTYNWEATKTHEKKVFSNESIGDIILSILEEVKEHSGLEYVCRWVDGALSIDGRGSNTDVCKFDSLCTMSTQNKISINDLVTKVKVLGTADDEGRSPVDAEVDGDQTFGVMQRILIRDSDKTIEAAITEAEIYIKENSTPEEEISIQVPDISFLRKGDKVEVCAGNLIGTFYVIGVTHTATTKEMTLTLKR